VHGSARETTATLSDLDQTVAYRLAQQGRGQATGSGPTWFRSAAPAHLSFFPVILYSFIIPC
jgi:hypothetical protein